MAECSVSEGINQTHSRLDEPVGDPTLCPGQRFLCKCDGGADVIGGVRFVSALTLTLSCC